jgi:aspartate/methionine/tyrosine aminotransferase
MDSRISLSDRAKKVLELSSDVVPEHSEVAPEAARNAAIAALERGETHYTDRPGILPLRKKVAEMLNARYNLEADPNTIVITCGDTEARFVSVQCLLGSDEALLCLENASWLEPSLVVRDARLVKPGEGLERVKVLYLTSDTSETQRNNYLQRAKDNNWWVVFEVTSDNTFHPARDIALKDKVVTIGGIGNSRGLESWRVGFLHAPKGEAPKLRSFKQALTICTTSLSQYAALAVLEVS